MGAKLTVCPERPYISDRPWNIHDSNNKSEVTFIVHDSQQTEIAVNHSHKFS
jgi:hypothetical protein